LIRLSIITCLNVFSAPVATAQKSFGGWGFNSDPDTLAHVAPRSPSAAQGRQREKE